MPTFSLILEKTTIIAGEPIRGELRSETPIRAKFYVLLSSLLFPGTEAVPKHKTLYYEERELKQGSFEFAYPIDLPPTIHGRAHRVRWGILFGIPRMGGKLLYPRKDVRIKVFPRKPAVKLPDWIELDKEFYKSYDIVRAKIRDESIEPANSLLELEAEEWLSLKNERREMRYLLSEGTLKREGLNTIAEVRIPYDPTRVEDFSFFFPYNFTYRSGDFSFGARVNLVLTHGNEERRAEIPVWTGEPRYARGLERQRGPLF